MYNMSFIDMRSMNMIICAMAQLLKVTLGRVTVTSQPRGTAQQPAMPWPHAVSAAC